jgi:hypothetical protein
MTALLIFSAGAPMRDLTPGFLIAFYPKGQFGKPVFFRIHAIL